jgi:hypothetical protein
MLFLVSLVDSISGEGRLDHGVKKGVSVRKFWIHPTLAPNTSTCIRKFYLFCYSYPYPIRVPVSFLPLALRHPQSGGALALHEGIKGA